MPLIPPGAVGLKFWTFPSARETTVEIIGNLVANESFAFSADLEIYTADSTIITADAETGGGDSTKGRSVSTVSFQQAVTQAGSSGSYSLAFTVAAAFGQERLVALCAVAKTPIAGVDFTSVTIDGQAATQVGATARTADPSGNGPIVAFFRAVGTSSTSINVAFNISSSGVFDARAALWTLNDADVLLASTPGSLSGVVGGTLGSGTASLNLNATTGGVVAAIVFQYDSSVHDIVWTGLSERQDATTSLYGGDWFSVADLNAETVSTPLTVTAATSATTFAPSSALSGLAVSFNPEIVIGGFAGTVTGAAGVTGTLAATDDTDTAAFTGLTAAFGTLAVTDVTDAAVFAGSVQWFGTLAATEGTDTAAFTGLTAAFGVLAATEGSDVAAFTAPTTTTGTLTATEGIDTAAFTGTAVTLGTLAVTEAADTSAFTGSVYWAGTLAATEGSDTPAFTGTVLVSGTLARTEGADTSLFTGTVAFPVRTGTLAVTEAEDVFAAAGTVANLRIGEMAAVEGSALTADSTLYTADNDDIRVNSYVSDEAAAFAGYIAAIGVLAATEARDVSAFAGEVFDGVTRIGTLEAFEDHYPPGMFPTADSAVYTADSTVLTADKASYGGDIAAFTGAVGVFVFGTMAPYEMGDSAVFTQEAYTGIFGPLVAQEGADGVGFDSADFGGGIFPPAIWEEIDQGLENETQRMFWLANRTGRVTWLKNEVQEMTWLRNLTERVVLSRDEVERIEELELL